MKTPPPPPPFPSLSLWVSFHLCVSSQYWLRLSYVSKNRLISFTFVNPCRSVGAFEGQDLHLCGSPNAWSTRRKILATSVRGNIDDRSTPSKTTTSPTYCFPVPRCQQAYSSTTSTRFFLGGGVSNLTLSGACKTRGAGTCRLMETAAAS